MRLPAIACLFLATACNAQQPPKPADTPAPQASSAPKEPANQQDACAVITGTEWCGVKFGDGPETAEAKFEALANPLMRSVSDLVHDANACYMMTTVQGPGAVAFIIENRKIGRVDIGIDGPRTPEGIGVGSTEAELKKAYPSAKGGPTKYDANVTEYAVPSGAGKVIFEVEAQRVRALKAGIPPVVDYVERCG
jgi:hypothetical protein